MRKFVDLIFLVRPPLLAASATFFFAGAVSAHRAAVGSYRISLLKNALPGLGLYMLVVGFSFVVNQIFDVASDAINRKNLIMPAGAVSRRESAALAIGLGAAIAAASVAIAGPTALLGAAGALLGLAYSLPPVRLKARPVADLAANTVGFGWIGFLMGWLAYGGLERDAFVRSIPYAMAMAAIFLNTCIPDEAGDRAAGDATSCVVFGKKAVAVAALALLAGAFVAGLAFDELVCAVAVLAALPAFAAVAVDPSARNSVVASQLAARAIFILIAILAPVLAGIGAAAYVPSKVYYARRFGADYPRLTGARFGAGG